MAKHRWIDTQKNQLQIFKSNPYNHGKTKRATLQKRNVNLANKNEM